MQLACGHGKPRVTTGHLPCRLGRRPAGWTENQWLAEARNPTLGRVRIREIDVHNDAEFSRWFVILRAAELDGREEMPFWSEHECAVMMRRDEPGEVWRCFAAFEGEASDETMTGVAIVVLPLLDNTKFAFIGASVAPEDRNRGIGSALVDFIVAHARAEGRTRMLAETNLAFADREDHPYRTFAEHRGFSLANVEVRRRLDLPVDDVTIQAWIDDAAPHHADYRIETFVDDIPDELLPSLCHVLNQLAVDAPTGDVDFEEESMTPETFKIRRAKLAEMGRTIYETVAIAPDGDVVAHSTLGVPADDDNAFQWGTLVRRDHRGHRLGMAVKAANLRRMQKAHPDQKRIITTNSEVNAPMVGINEAMGFEPVELLAEFQLLDEE